jgi:hypothetical protein
MGVHPIALTTGDRSPRLRPGFPLSPRASHGPRDIRRPWDLHFGIRRSGLVRIGGQGVGLRTLPPNLSETARSPPGVCGPRSARGDGRHRGPRSSGWFGLLDRRTGNPARRRPNAPRSQHAFGLDPSGGAKWTGLKAGFVAGLHGRLPPPRCRGHPQHGSHGRRATDLRRRMRAAGVTFRVAKNRLAHLALEGTRLTADGDAEGPTALAWSTDPVATARRPSKSPGPTTSSC